MNYCHTDCDGTSTHVASAVVIRRRRLISKDDITPPVPQCNTRSSAPKRKSEVHWTRHLTCFQISIKHFRYQVLNGSCKHKSHRPTTTLCHPPTCRLGIEVEACDRPEVGELPEWHCDVAGPPIRDWCRIPFVNISSRQGQSTLTGSLVPTVNHVSKAACIGVRHYLFAVASPVDYMKADNLKFVIPALPILDQLAIRTINLIRQFHFKNIGWCRFHGDMPRNDICYNSELMVLNPPFLQSVA